MTSPVDTLKALVDAVEAEFCGEATERLEPDDSKVSYPEDRCHITFGHIRRAKAAIAALSGGEAVASKGLRDELQTKCSAWGTYWRAPDAHGVILPIEQATELLRDALAVEVEITTPRIPDGCVVDAAMVERACIASSLTLWDDPKWDKDGRRDKFRAAMRQALTAALQPDSGEG